MNKRGWKHRQGKRNLEWYHPDCDAVIYRHVRKSGRFILSRSYSILVDTHSTRSRVFFDTLRDAIADVTTAGDSCK